MIEYTLALIHNISTFLFGVYASAFLLGVRRTGKNVFVLFLFSLSEGIIYFTGSLCFGQAFLDTIYPIIYPLIIHLPLCLFILLYYKYSFIRSFVSVLTAYMCCQISNWTGLLTLELTQEYSYYYLTRIITTIIVFVILLIVVCPKTSVIFARPKQEVIIVGVFPFVYYIYDYFATKLSTLMYSGNKPAVEFMSFLFCLTYLSFLLVYFSFYKQNTETKQHNTIMKMQLESIHKEIEHVNTSKKTLSILKHDMRHHLNIIQMFLNQNKTEKVREYIGKISGEYENTVIAPYCNDEMLNSVISIYIERFNRNGIQFKCDISGNITPFSSLPLCTILSNALENAMTALEKVSTDDKWASLNISSKNNKLMICLENAVNDIPKFVDGMPVSDKEDHGIGTKSIVYYVEQLNGQWHFSIKDKVFVLKIIL